MCSDRYGWKNTKEKILERKAKVSSEMKEIYFEDEYRRE